MFRVHIPMLLLEKLRWPMIKVPRFPIWAMSRSFGMPDPHSATGSRYTHRDPACTSMAVYFLSVRKKTLADLTATGYLASTALAFDMAKEIREQRYRLKANATSHPSRHPIGNRRLDCFRKHHLDIQGT